MLKAIVAAAFMQYTTAAIAMPWDVGKLLLQVQWVPREPDASKNTILVEGKQEEDEEVCFLEARIHIQGI